MSKRIVNIVPAFVPGDGIGNAARVRVAGLLKRGYQVTVICATAKVGEDEFPGLTLLEAGAGWEAGRESLTLEMHSAVHSADLLFLEFGCFNICHELLMGLVTPLVLFYQGLTPATLMQSDMYTSCYWRAIGELRKIPKPSMVLAASQFTLKEYERIAGAFDGPSQVVPLFGNSQHSSDVSKGDRVSETLQVLTVGQLFPHKNYEVLIDAVRILSSEGIDIVVRHIGGANDFVARSYREHLLRLAKPLGDRIQFLGKVEQSVLDQSYQDADIVVIPSLHEGYSLPAREALMHGKPVVASSFGALPETLEGVAEHFHPLDAHELASKLRNVAAWSADQWKQARQQSLDAAPSHSKERYVEACVRAIESTVAANHVEVNDSLDYPEGDKNHIAISESATLLTGKIAVRNLNVDTSSCALEAWILSDKHILQSRVRARIRWRQQDEMVECFYELPLSDAEDWTAVYFQFIDHKSGDRLLELPGVCRQRKEPVVCAPDDYEFTRLANSITQCYGPKSIAASDGRFITKIKTQVANTLLRLIYQVFVGPQMSTMQSQLRLFRTELRGLRAEVESLQQARNSLHHDKS